MIPSLCVNYRCHNKVKIDFFLQCCKKYFSCLQFQNSVWDLDSDNFAVESIQFSHSRVLFFVYSYWIVVRSPHLKIVRLFAGTSQTTLVKMQIVIFGRLRCLFFRSSNAFLSLQSLPFYSVQSLEKSSIGDNCLLRVDSRCHCVCECRFFREPNRTTRRRHSCKIENAPVRNASRLSV